MLDNKGALILEFIENSRSVRIFILWGVSDVRVVGCFLLAVSKSLSITEIILTNLRMSADSLEKIVGGMHSLTQLSMSTITIMESPNEECTGETPVEMFGNESIEELEIINVRKLGIFQVLKEFGSHSNIKRFSIDGYRWNTVMSVSLPKRIQHLLEASATLESVEFKLQCHAHCRRGHEFFVIETSSGLTKQ
jgi:hypothetical protein